MRIPALLFLLPILASLTLTAGASEAGGTGQNGQPNLTPDQQATWAEMQKSGGVPGKDAMAAEAKYIQALAYYRAARFVEAKEVVDQALALYPPHRPAQKLREQILGLLSLREDRLQMASAWLQDIQDVRTQEMAVRLAGLMASGDKKMASGDFSGAAIDYDRVWVGLHSFPYQFDWGKLPDEVAGKRLQAQAQAREQELQQQRADREKAQAEAKEQTQIEEDALKAKVDELLRRAQVAFDRKDYKRAEIDAWNAYELDRRREDARSLYLSARDHGHKQFDASYREERLERDARVHEVIHQGLIPQTELLIYPTDWKRRALRKADELGATKQQPWMADIQQRLQQQVTFNFDEQPFDEVVKFFRQTTGVNIVTAPEIFTAGGGGTVTLKANNMKFGDALAWVLRLTNLHMAIQNQAIYISNTPVSGAVELRMYDVADLISPVEDFKGMELAYTSSGGGGGGGAGGAQTDIFATNNPAADAGKGQVDADGLIDFIKKNVSPTSWDQPGVGIDHKEAAVLLVSQTPEVHALVSQLLTNLRNQLALQVSTTVRLLDVRKGYFEEIGVDYTNSQPTFPANQGILAASSGSGYAHLNQTGAFNGSVIQNLPGNATTDAFTAGNNGVYTKGLQVETSYNLTNFLNQDQINSIFSAVENETDAQIVDSPSVTCFNGQRAHADFLTQYAYIQTYTVVNNNLQPTISILNFGDIIDVRPVVSSDHKYITFEIRPTSVTLQGVFVEVITAPRVITAAGGLGGAVVVLNLPFPLELPNILVRTLRTTVMMPDKGNLLIGGFNHSLTQRTHSGIPFISHIPFLGRLFSRNGVYDEDRQLFYLLNAEIIDLGEREAMQ